MKVLISGASGLVGHALMLRLRQSGHEVTRLVRDSEPPPDAIAWDPAHGRLDPRPLNGFDGVVHLAGENIAKGRWTDAKKQRIRDSRVDGTRLLVTSLLETSERPKVFVGASAIGYYGDRGDDVMTEASAPGEGFLPEVCREWEARSQPLEDAGTRVVRLRIGVVLSPEGGALAKMLTPFRFGLGGRIGDGSQWMSWIVLEELCAIIEHALERDDLRGAVNAVAPNPVTNEEFTTELGKALRRPTALPLPAFAVRMLFGQMGEELLLSSTRVHPERLVAAGYAFRHPTIESAFRDLL